MNKEKTDKMRHKTQGFTIIELIIATSIFGVIMLLSTAGVLYIGKVYYKGVITSKTQETTRSVIQEISNSYQYGGSSVTLVNSSSYGPFNVRAQCIGRYRYSYATGLPIKDNNVASESIRHAIWTDIIQEGSTSCNPLDITKQTPPFDSISDRSASAVLQNHELLGTNMRLETFSLTQSPGQSFANINIKVIYGDLSLSPGGTCVSSRSGGQFCATSELNTTVKQRL